MINLISSSPLLSRPLSILSSKTIVLSTGSNPDVADPPIDLTSYSLPAVKVPSPWMVSFSLPTKDPFLTLISLFNLTGVPSALILISFANTPEVLRLSSTFNLKPIFALPFPITFKNTLPSLLMNFAFGFENGTAGFTVGGTAGISLSSSTGLNGVIPSLLKKSPKGPTSGLIL